MTNTKYTTLSPVLYVHPAHPGIILIHNNATCVSSSELKLLYDDNPLVFHEVCVIEQALIQ